MNCAVTRKNLNVKCFCSVFIILLLLCSWIAVVEAQDETVTVEITNLPDGVQNGVFEVTIAFSEAVVSFETSDIEFGDDSVDASVTELTTPDEGAEDHKTVYTAEITPADDVNGDLTFQVAENVVKSANADADAEDNNTASDSHTVKVDLVPPAVSITDAPTTVKLGAFEVIITFTEPVSDFEADDIQLTGDVDASVTDLTTPAEGAENHRIVWIAEITPDASTDTDGDITLQVPEDVVEDAALNNNAASESQTIQVDVTLPTVSITDVPRAEKNEAFDLTITFSEPVNGFVAGDITLTGPATVSLTTGSDGDTEYRVTITPDDDLEADVTIQVREDVVEDLVGNTNTASTEHTVHVDTVPPTVVISDPPEAEKNVAFDITITFSEAVNDFVADNIILTGPATASLKSGSDGDSVYEITITPNSTSEGDVTFQVPADAATDFAQNGNEASTEIDSVHVDTIPPTVEITGVPDIEKNEAFDVTITFSEPVNGFAVGDITLTGPATISLAEETDSVYRGTITPNQVSEGDVTFHIPAAIAQDFALNDNIASDSHTVHIDTILPTVESITGIPTIEKNVPFDITITFSEPVNGFVAGDITLTGPATASLKSGSDGNRVYEIAITPNPTSEGDVTFQVPADAATDFAQNPNEASTETDSVHIDTIPPTVEITGVPDIEKNEAFDVTITFSEPINGFVAGDITLTGPATLTLKEGNDGDSIYKVAITPNPSSEGDVIFLVPAAAVKDFALNDNTASGSHTVHIDTIPPTVEITGIPDIEKNVAFDITITFSEPVNGFAVGDITLTGPATVNVISGSDGDSVYKAKITPNPTSEDDVEFYVSANAVRDLALNANGEPSNRPKVHVDTIPPTVESITGVPTIKKNVPFDITLTFSEPVNGFVAGDITLTGPATATLKEGNDGGNVYKVAITPNSTSEGDVTFQVPADAATDLAQNPNEASTETDPVHIDTILPTVKITGVPTIEKNVPFDITITFSEPVNGFVADDITLTGHATISLEKETDSVYKGTITPNQASEGDVTFRIPAAIAQDFALNENIASDSHTVHIDTILPTVKSITGVPTIEKNVPFDITITFSEPINGFVAGDITLTGHATTSLKSGSDGDTVYEITITPKTSSEGDVIFHVPAAVVKDFALNNNTASGSHTVHIDTILPTVEITGVPTIEKNVPFDITLTFSEPVNGFVVGDITLTGPATATLKEGNDGDRVYEIAITPKATSEGDVTFQVPADAAIDFAQNGNKASTETDPVHIDTIPPTVKITGVPTIEKNVPFDITITFSEPVNGFQVGDIRLTGPATISLAKETDSVYKVTITPDSTSEGDVEFQIPAAAAKDFALNDNIVSASHVVHVDTIPPEVSIVPVLGNTDVFDAVQLEMFSLQIVFSEDVLEFEVKDITLTGDAVVETSELTGGRRTYVLTITPHEDTDGNVIIKVAPGIAKDHANNLNNPSAEHTIYVAPKWIPDPNIRAVVREEIGLDQGKDFTRKRLEDLTILEGFYRQIIDLTGLEYATNLTSLNLEGNSVTDLSPLLGLTDLKRLNLNNNTINNVNPLADLTELTLLELKGNQITDLTPFQGLTRLTSLDLRENIISDLEPLTGLVSLTDLYLTTNQISDVSPLADLSNLVTLWISENPIKNAAPLVGLAETIETDIVIPSLVVDPALRDAIRAALGVDSSKRLTISALQTLTTLQAELSGIRNLTGLKHATALTMLELNGNSIIDITPIRGLIQLTTLNLSNNAIVDITPLKGFIALTVLNLSNNPIGNLETLAALVGLTTLELSGNSINNLEVISSLTGLLKLNISDNSIIDITPIQNLRALTALNLSNNPIGNLNVIASLARLTTLELSGNSITDLIPLAGLTRLTMLNLNDNAVRNLMPLANLRNLTTLNLGSNAISVLGPITSLRDLKALDLNNNSISDVSPLASLTQLDTLNLSANTISNVEPFAALINLATLRLAGNPILDTTVLYPLTQRVPPVDIDISVSQYPPWDVNQDGSVNAIDSAFVTAALGQSGDDIVLPRTDVNRDGTVDNADFLLVSENFDENAAGAPSTVDILAGLRPQDREMLEAQLEILISESDGSLKYLRAIALLQSLLTELHPDKTRLFANYPNPFNPETWIPYQLADSSDVQIFIYDVRGAVIRHLKLGHQPAGYYIERKHAAYWDGRNAMGESVASGIYFYQLQTDNLSLLREMVILK